MEQYKTVYKLLISSAIFPILQAAYPNFYKPVTTLNPPLSDEVGEPLILTNYLREGNIEEARAASLVSLKEFPTITSYSGFFTVDEAFDSNLFFWFIPSEGDYTTDPLLLWLQGGPGASSLYALFYENGPFVVSERDEFSLREYAWTKNNSVIYIDNPVGTGYSFTNGGFAKNETIIGKHLYEALQQFFTLFPELSNNSFFITGESYAGKYIPALGYTILKKNPSAEAPINLQGLLIGNGLSDPENMVVEYGNYLFEIGLIDTETKALFIELQDEAVQYIKDGDFVNAFVIFDMLINGDFTSPTIYANATGPLSYFNYLSDEPEDSSYEEYLQSSDVRKAIHVGNLSYSSEQVEENLSEDVMQSVAPWVSELLSTYRVLFYNGQLDVIVAYPLTVNFLRNLDFDSAESYKAANRNLWKVDGLIAGYVKTAGNLTEIMVRDAGHMVPADQPKWSYDLVYKFTRGISFN